MTTSALTAQATTPAWQKKQMQIILPVRLQDKKRTSEPDIKVIKKVDQ